MDTVFTLGLILKILAVIVSIVAGITAIVAVIRWLNSAHDQKTKYDNYDKDISDIKEEQCMLTYCMLAVLDGLKQQGCNGKVTEARDALDKYINKKAHDME